MNPFLITGLPRSRTAWFSALACIPPAICYHEPIAQMVRWQDHFALWERSPYIYTGVSDSALGFHLDEIIRVVNPKILIIERNPEEVKASARAIGMPCDTYIDLLHKYLSQAKGTRIKRVAFEDLNDALVVMDCLRHVLPGLIFDRNRVSEMMHLNVQECLDHSTEAAERLNPEEALGADVASQLRSASCR